MAEVDTTLSQQKLVDALITLVTTYESEMSILKSRLDADTTDPVDPYSHHAYRMIDYGENKQLKELLYETSVNGVKGLVGLINKYNTSTVTITFDLNNCTGTAPTLNPQIPDTECTLPQITGLTAPDVPAAEIGQKIFKIYGWNTKADGTGDTYLPGSKYIVPKTNTTLYAFVAYDRTFVPTTSGSSGTP